MANPYRCCLEGLAEDALASLNLAVRAALWRDMRPKYGHQAVRFRWTSAILIFIP